MAVPEESERQALPGKEGQVTRNQFLAYLRDGKLLTKLANALDVRVSKWCSIVNLFVQEGAIEEAKTDSENQSDIKAVQEQNVESFCKWVNEKLNTEESKVLTLLFMSSACCVCPKRSWLRQIHYALAAYRGMSKQLLSY